MKPRVLVAGMGNDLCQDDGFGIVAVRRFVAAGAPEGVRVVEPGSGGISLVQDLMDGYEALIIVDAVDRGGEPGAIYLLETEVPQFADLSEEEQNAFLADMHATVPSRVLTLAQALGVLPGVIYILGCQPMVYELGMGLSAPVERGVTEAVTRLQALTATIIGDPIAISSGY
ncbi:MAG: hydrogenase maturation protease [Thermomicrobia bacterium]|nr:hydrogenase maturation protease [Thermomicrobia bacterium]